MDFDPSPNRFQRLIWPILGGLIVLTFLLLLLRGRKFFFSPPPKPLDVVISSGTVKEGDIMSTILEAKNVPPDLVTKIQATIGKSFDLRRMKPKDTFEVATTTTNVFLKFIYHNDPTHAYIIERSSMGVLSSTEEFHATTWEEKIVSCKIQEFLYRDLLKQGYSENFVANFTAEIGDSIFPWQIDFLSEQRPGDVVQVLLQQEELTETRAAVHRLKVLAAYYQGSGTRKKDNYAVRYRIPGANRDDFYDLDGNAIRKAFLRAPFTIANFRISSNWSQSRFHPILRVWRPHHGTDYAAPYGTRVSCIGKGTVIFAGWKNGYGNCVEVRHNSTYVSRYGHLSRIGVRPGTSVQQGGYVGNVGNTGLSTGPHLHFEILVNGVSKNFLKMDFPAASSVPAANLDDFKRVRDEVMNRLNQKVAQAASTPTKGNP